MEAVINDYVSLELLQEAALEPLANATPPPLLETGVLESPNLGGGRG